MPPLAKAGSTTPRGVLGSSLLLAFALDTQGKATTCHCKAGSTTPRGVLGPSLSSAFGLGTQGKVMVMLPWCSLVPRATFVTRCRGDENNPGARGSRAVPGAGGRGQFRSALGLIWDLLWDPESRPNDGEIEPGRRPRRSRDQLIAEGCSGARLGIPLYLIPDQ